MPGGCPRSFTARRIANRQSEIRIVDTRRALGTRVDIDIGAVFPGENEIHLLFVEPQGPYLPSFNM
jgi:hypothetical protein